MLLALWGKIQVYVLTLLPALIAVFSLGYKRGRQSKVEQEKKFLKDTIERELEKNAEIVKERFDDKSASDTVREVIGSDRKRNDG